MHDPARYYGTHNSPEPGGPAPELEPGETVGPACDACGSTDWEHNETIDHDDAAYTTAVVECVACGATVKCPGRCVGEFISAWTRPVDDVAGGGDE